MLALICGQFFDGISESRAGHAFQYALVGIALCLFYLGLLALSEVASFSTAYWTGAAAASPIPLSGSVDSSLYPFPPR